LSLFHYENGHWLNRTSSRDFGSKTIGAQTATLSPFAIAQPLAPTAAHVSLSGRAIDSNGRGIPSASFSLTGSSGDLRTSISNPFGFYAFDRVEVGQTYVMSIGHKRYTFDPNVRVINVIYTITALDFVATPAGRRTNHD
jgi:hypothetical protein